MSCVSGSVVPAGTVYDIVPSANMLGGVSSVQVDVGPPLVSVSHNSIVKAVVVAETMSTPVRMYPDGFEPVVNLCEANRSTK